MNARRRALHEHVGHDGRHHRVHVARTGARRRCSTRAPICSRLASSSTRWRPAGRAFRGTRPPWCSTASSIASPSPPSTINADAAARARSHHLEGAREGPHAALSDRRRHPRGSAAFAAGFGIEAGPVDAVGGRAGRGSGDEGDDARRHVCRKSRPSAGHADTERSVGGHSRGRQDAVVLGRRGGAPGDCVCRSRRRCISRARRTFHTSRSHTDGSAAAGHATVSGGARRAAHICTTARRVCGAFTCPRVAGRWPGRIVDTAG